MSAPVAAVCTPITRRPARSTVSTCVVITDFTPPVGFFVVYDDDTQVRYDDNTAVEYA